MGLTMKTSDLINGVISFFNDLIGSIFPGFVLLSGLYLINIRFSIVSLPMLSLDQTGVWGSLIVFTYVAGHGLLSFKQLIDKIPCLTAKRIKIRNESALYKSFEKCLKRKFEASDAWDTTSDFDKFSAHDIRNIAMTISSEGQRLAVRFMFISLLCDGVAAAIIVLIFCYILAQSIYGAITFHEGIVLIVSAFIIYCFHKRAGEFFTRSLNTPFPTALTELLLLDKDEKE